MHPFVISELTENKWAFKQNGGEIHPPIAADKISILTQKLKEEAVSRENTDASNELALSELQKQLQAAKTQFSVEQQEAQTLLRRAEEAEAELGRQQMQHVLDLRVLQQQVEALQKYDRHMISYCIIYHIS